MAAFLAPTALASALRSSCRATGTTAEATEAVYYRRCLPTKLRLDRIYQQRRSVALDLWIIANTMMTVIIPGWVRRR